MWRSSWKFLLQVSNLPPLSRPLSAHLGLQRFRLQGPPFALHALLNGNFSPSFSTAAEAASMANSAEAEAIPSADSAEIAQGSTHGHVASATPEGERALRNIVEEHRQLVHTLRAELEENKILTRSILDEIRVLKSKVDAETEETKPSEKKRLWPEWTAFLEHLQSSEYFKDEKRAPPLNGGSIFEDQTCVKRAINRFSQAHDSIFESLSQIDLRIIATYGCTNNDSKAAASQKRLRQYFHLEAISTEDVGDKSSITQPKLSDVTRLLHTTILEGASEEDVRLSISYLLREIIILSRRSSEASPCMNETTVHSSRPSAVLSPSALDIIESSKPDKDKVLKKENVDVQKLDTAVGEGRMNSGRGEARLETTVQSPSQWKCPRCSFLNLDTKHRCVECSRKRPQRTYADNTSKGSEDISLLDEDTDQDPSVLKKQAKKVSLLDEDEDEDPSVHKKLAKKANEGKDSMLSLTTQGREISKGRVPCMATEDNTDVDRSSSDENAENKDPFDVLDDILDEESDDLAEGGKKASLSGLFTRPPKRDVEQRNSSQRPGRRPFKSKRHEDDDDNGRSRHGSIGGDEDENSLDDDEPTSRRGFESRDDEGYSRRFGRGGFRGRGGGRGYRGGSYDERRNDGGPRGMRAFGDRDRAFGDRDRGSRSDGFGSRSPRGRSRY